MLKLRQPTLEEITEKVKEASKYSFEEIQAHIRFTVEEYDKIHYRGGEEVLQSLENFDFQSSLLKNSKFLENAKIPANQISKYFPQIQAGLALHYLDTINEAKELEFAMNSGIVSISTAERTRGYFNWLPKY